jgi:hypothetical protein
MQARSEERVHPVIRFDSYERDALIESLYAAFERRIDMPRTLQDLASAHPVPSAVMHTLHDAIHECGDDEERVIAAFLAWLGAHADTRLLHQDFTAMLRGQVAGLRGSRALLQFMTERFEP